MWSHQPQALPEIRFKIGNWKPTNKVQNATVSQKNPKYRKLSPFPFPEGERWGEGDLKMKKMPARKEAKKTSTAEKVKWFILRSGFHSLAKGRPSKFSIQRLIFQNRFTERLGNRDKISLVIIKGQFLPPFINQFIFRIAVHFKN